MALGIGQQLKHMVDRARHYWSELTDEDGSRRRHEQEEREEAVHQRYGGVRAQGERDLDKMLQDHEENSMDRGLSDAELANPAVRAARGDTSPSRMGRGATGPSGPSGRPGEPTRQGEQLGSQDLQDQPRHQQMQGNPQQPGDAQRQRQYTQQGGSGIQKTLAEQLGASTPQTGATGAGIGSEADTVRSSQARRPDQQNH